MSSPLIDVYNKLWEVVEDCPSLMELVRPANRIKVVGVGGTDPLKDRIQEGDLPELLLQPMFGASTSIASSSAVKFVRTFQFAVTTGEQGADRLLDIDFMLSSCLVRAYKVVPSLTWNGKSYVKRLTITDQEAGKTPFKRNIEGWVGLHSIDVEMHFAYNEIVNFALT